MEFLRELFAQGALTFEQFTTAVNEKGFKLADLSQGQYVDKQKFDNKIEEAKNIQTQLDTANETIKGFTEKETTLKDVREKAAKYDEDMQAWEEKYNNSVKDYALREALMIAGARNPKAVAAVLDLSAAEFKEGKWEGLEDIITAHKETEDYMYESEEQGSNPPPKFTKKASEGGKTMTVDEIMSISDSAERAQAIMENKNLFEK